MGAFSHLKLQVCSAALNKLHLEREGAEMT